MKFFKETLKKLFAGFIYGVGFIFGIWVITVFVIDNIDIPINSHKNVIDSEESRINPKETSYTILSSEAIVRPYLIDVIGTLRNTGNSPTKFTELVVDLYSKNSNFIYQCKGWVSESIQPGEEVNFKVECHGMTKEIYQDYSSYKIKVTR